MERYRQSQHHSTGHSSDHAPQPAQHTEPAVVNAASQSRENSGAFFPNPPSLSVKILIIALIIASLVVTIALAGSLIKSLDNTSLVKENQYQAVFLDNGQVYFGRLSGINDSYVQLSDIYYLQVEQQVQPEQKKAEGEAAADEAGADEQTGENPQISLAKLGKELHGPEDVMYIQNNKIVFWENLKDDGQVVEAIRQYVDGQQNQ